ncbi:MAG: hypothetical protein NT069_29695 [Planctomycetota bacterium]|nr:hypothetical protein [Planctomycetota bacterium]
MIHNDRIASKQEVETYQSWRHADQHRRQGSQPRVNRLVITPFLNRREEEE